MARTRNLDPGRVPALHYAFTRLRRHAKRQVYAFFLLAGLGNLPVPFVGRTAAAGQGAAAVPCASCQVLSVTPGQVAALPARLDAARLALRIAADGSGWQPAVAALRERGARVGVHVVGVPAENDARLDAEADIFILEPPAGDPEQQAFELKRALAAARGRHPAASLILALPADRAAALRERGIEPYVDAIVPAAQPIQAGDDLARPHDGSLRVRVVPDSSADAAPIVTAAVTLQRWLPEGLAPLRERALTCEGRPVETYLNPRSLDLIGVSASCRPPATVTSDVPGAAIERLDLATVSVFLVHAGQTDRFAEGVDVAAARTLTVEEILARHQAAAARQAAAIETLISDGSMALTFEAPGFVAPVTITSRPTIFRGADAVTDIRQADIRVNGVAFASGGGVPKLPIIEPERVAAPPLTITLTDVYRYRLEGRETLHGRECYVVSFAPSDGPSARAAASADTASLYRGRAWIDAATFAMVQVQAAQTGLRGAIVASEQTDTFAPDAEGRWLLTRSDVHQTYEGASIRTPIHRLLIVERHAVNAPDFAARRQAALASNDVMLRDTPEGFRYLAKPKAGSGKREAGSGQPEAGSGKPEAGVRVLAGRAARVRTFAFGAIFDPNISRPLPFAGVSYVDFDLFGTGAQFSGFFGGTYGQLAFSAPSLRGTRWQLAGRAFGLASSYNDRAFEDGREQYALDIRQRPAQAAVWLLRPLTARTSLRLEYGWDYNRYGRHDVTAPDFVVPRNQNAHTLRIGLDAQRRGWQASIWASHSRRIGWRAWGLPAQRATFSEAEAQYQRYGASLLRSQAVSPRVTVRVEAAVMDGSGLDRFSRYAFGTFDNRLHGYPAALIRYDRGGVIRTAAAMSLLRVMRLDAFADTAAVHDPGFGRGLRPYTGLGAALEAPAPFGTLLSLEWGYGLQGIDSDGRRGTHVVRLSGYKVF